MILSVLLVLGYQFWYKRRKGDGDQDKDFNKYDRYGKSKQGGQSASSYRATSSASATATSATNLRSNLAANLSETTKSLEEKLSAMDKRLESLGPGFGGSSKGKSRRDDDDDDYGTQEISYKKYE